MPKLLRQRRAEHWAAFMTAMAERLGADEPSKESCILSDDANAACAASLGLMHQAPQATPPPQHVIDAFGALILQTVHHRLRMPAWWRERTYRKFGRQCAYCDRPLAAGPAFCLDHVIPPAIGGPNHADAVVLCCRGCKRAKAGRDVLLWRRELPPHLRAMRHRLALESQNHPVMVSQRRATTQEGVLSRRWRQPRFACHFMPATGGALVGWARPMDAPVNIYMSLLYEQGAQSCLTSAQMNASPVIFWMPAADDGLNFASGLIDQNAWIQLDR